MAKATIQETEQALLVEMDRRLGYTPPQTRELLRVLTGPVVIDLMDEYIKAKRLLP